MQAPSDNPAQEPSTTTGEGAGTESPQKTYIVYWDHNFQRWFLIPQYVEYCVDRVEGDYQ